MVWEVDEKTLVCVDGVDADEVEANSQYQNFLLRPFFKLDLNWKTSPLSFFLFLLPSIPKTLLSLETFS